MKFFAENEHSGFHRGEAGLTGAINLSRLECYGETESPLAVFNQFYNRQNTLTLGILGTLGNLGI